MPITFEEKIEECSKRFLNSISSLCREGFDVDKPRERTYKSGFSMFGVADEKYYKSRYQEEYLEWMIRDLLVNELLDFLFKDKGYDIRWRLGDSTMTTGGFTNVENESVFPVEFFIVENGKFTAYRYTPFTADYSIKWNLPADIIIAYRKTGVDSIAKWISVDWSSFSQEEFEEKRKKDKRLFEPYQTYLSLEGLFEKYFSPEEYSLFVETISKAVQEANRIIGFQTISRLVPENAAVFREMIIKDILGTDFNNMEYQMVGKDGTIESSPYPLRVSESVVQENFEQKSRYEALIGNTKFSKSFITAEYLYRIFKDGLALDYTPVVTGYIKAVEQLCEIYIKNFILPDNSGKLYYLSYLSDSKHKTILEKIVDKKKIGKCYYVKVSPQNEEYYISNPTLGQMRFIFQENKLYLFDCNMSRGIQIIMNCWDNFIEFDRNGYFHKDNIDDFSVAERVRNNSLLLIYWLLGSITPKMDESSLLEALGIFDDTFDRTYRKIAYRNQFRYRIRYGEEEFLAIRIQEKLSHSFDENGHIIDGELKFAKVGEYPKNVPTYREYIPTVKEKDIIRVRRDNMPDGIVLIESNGVEKIIF